MKNLLKMFLGLKVGSIRLITAVLIIILFLVYFLFAN